MTFALLPRLWGRRSSPASTARQRRSSVAVAPTPPPTSATMVTTATEHTASSSGTYDITSSQPPSERGTVADLRQSSTATRPASKKTVETVTVKRRDHNIDDNQTGQSPYEIAKVNQYFSTPERPPSKTFVGMSDEDLARQNAKLARKNEKELKKAKRQEARAIRKGKAPPVPPTRGTVPFAIEHAKCTGVLNLAKLTPNQVPDSVFESIPGTARFINIAHNHLRVIDPRFTEFVLVQRLIANDNLLESIPSAISRMTELRKLDLARNNLASLPDVFSNMPHLEHLDLSENSLAALPDSLATRNLITLKLSNNHFTVPPRVIEGMSSLEELYLERNRLVAVPELWSRLANLSVLMLDENNIADIPDALLSDCRVLFGLSIKKNPISMKAIASKPSYNDFHSRRLNHFKWQIESGSMDRDQLLVTDGC
jgi:hypothetical protein